MNIFKFILCLLFVMGCAKHEVGASFRALKNAQQVKIEANDVAILMPLPNNTDDISKMIGVSSRGAYGEIVPLWLWEKLPVLRTGMSRAEIKPELRLVAVRFDPCFREGVDVANLPCRPQIRLVMQPIFYDETLRAISTRDTAIHLFYTLDTAELLKLISDVQALSFDHRAMFESAPVAVHPLLAQKGYSSDAYRDFASLLLTHIGEQKLIRLTFMTVAGLDVQWSFGGFDIPSERVKTEIVIPGTLGRFEQTITSNTRYPVPMFSHIVSAGGTPDNLTMFAKGEQLLKQPVEIQEAASFALHRVENPRFNNPGSVDCVSCHMATMARAWSIEKGLPSAKLSEFSYRPFGNNQNVSEADPRASVLRAFGYFNNKTAVSQRTLNEVDGTVLYLNH